MIRLSTSVRSKKSASVERDLTDNLRLSERITSVVQRERSSSPPRVMRINTRAAERLVPLQREVRVTMVNGKSFLARIMDLSTDAVALDADFSAVNDTDILSVGGKHVKMGRRLRSGAVFIFKKPLKGPLTPKVVL